MTFPEDVAGVLQSLEKAPAVLKGMLDAIPKDQLKKNRAPGKWSIHSHACHIVAVQPILLARVNRFLKEDRPEFKPYIPQNEMGEAMLLEMDLDETVGLFPEYREELFDRLKQSTPEFFLKKALHHEYIDFSPFIMLRHIMMHDYLHMYRIEELWLTRDEYFPSK